MAVVREDAKGLGGKLVNVFLTRFYGLKDAVHPCRMYSMKMDRVWMCIAVAESYPHSLAFNAPECRARNRAVQCPGGKLHSTGHLYQTRIRNQVELPDSLTIFQCDEFTLLQTC